MSVAGEVATSQAVANQAVADEFLARRERLNSKWRVTLQFRNRVIGGIPAVGLEGTDPEKERDILRVWLHQRFGDRLSEEELEAEIDKTMEETYASEEPKSTTTFKSVEGVGLYIEGRQVKAMLKEAGGRLGLGKRVAAVKDGKKTLEEGRPSLKQDLHEALHVDEDVIYLTRNGQPITEPDGTVSPTFDVIPVEKPDGYEVRPIHVIGPQGPRTSIKRSAYVDGAQIGFTVRILNAVILSEENLKDILAFGQDLGLGADRSQGNGKFTVIGFERVQ